MGCVLASRPVWGTSPIDRDGTYTGYHVSGEPTGPGYCKWTNRPCVVHCEIWRNRRPHGFGHISTSAGDVYIGELRNGFKDGWGRYFNATEEFCGDWRGNQVHGKGQHLCHTDEGPVFYAGRFSNGRALGPAVGAYGPIVEWCNRHNAESHIMAFLCAGILRVGGSHALTRDTLERIGVHGKEERLRLMECYRGMSRNMASICRNLARKRRWGIQTDCAIVCLRAVTY